MKALRAEATDLSPDALVYLREAVAAFYTDCLLSACVMLSIAAESEFLRLLGAAKNDKTYGKHFSRIGDGLSIRAKIWRFREAIKPMLALLPKSAPEELANVEYDGVLHSDCAERGGGAVRRQSALARPGVRLSATLHPLRRAVNAVAARLDRA